MKKWKTLANPADPSIWADVSNMWPTGRGSYETADVYGSASNVTASGETGDMICAWAFNTLSSTRTYYIGKYIWEGTTDRTGALGASAVATTGGHACQYGDITIVTRGTGASLISSSGGNFAALAGSPSARFVVVQSNCVVAFNTSANADAWHATDVGDYTNWTTGEAANGRILDNNGPITAAVAYGSDIYVFKTDSIFRMTYVGGVIKWQIQKVWNGLGCADSVVDGGCPAIATSRGIFFCGGQTESVGTGRYTYYLFDGTSPPYMLNREVDIAFGVGIPIFDPKTDTVSLYVYNLAGSGDYRTYFYYYSLIDDAWGSKPYITASSFSAVYFPLRGDVTAFGTYGPAGPIYSGTATAIDIYKKRTSSAPTAAAGSCYVKTHKIGGGDPNYVFGSAQTRFGPAAPILRRRSTYSSGSPALALTVDTFQELHDTSAAATSSVTESTLRDRFDFTVNDSFCQVKLTATDTDIEIDDISVKVAPAGRV